MAAKIKEEWEELREAFQKDIRREQCSKFEFKYFFRKIKYVGKHCEYSFFF